MISVSWCSRLSRLVYTEKVSGSIPLGTTNFFFGRALCAGGSYHIVQRDLMTNKFAVAVENLCPDLAFRDVEALALPFQSLELLSKIAEGGYSELHKVRICLLAS